jgi:hypothetical protein
MYSFDGITWFESSLTLPLTVTERKIAYGQGVFVITSDDTNEIQWSQDGLYWQAYTLTTTITGGYNAVAFGNPARDGRFVILPNNTGTGGVFAKIGATAKGRASIANQQIFEIRITEPGSGYATPPTITVTDPNNIEDVEIFFQQCFKQGFDIKKYGLLTENNERVVEYIEKEVPIEIIKYVEKETIREVPIEVIKEIEKIVVVEKEVPIEKIVEKTIEVPIEIIKEVIKEVPLEVIKEVEKIVEIIKEVPIESKNISQNEVIVEKIIQVPIEVEKIVEEVLKAMQKVY